MSSRLSYLTWVLGCSMRRRGRNYRRASLSQACRGTAAHTFFASAHQSYESDVSLCDAEGRQGPEHERPTTPRGRETVQVPDCLRQAYAGRTRSLTGVTDPSLRAPSRLPVFAVNTSHLHWTCSAHRSLPVSRCRSCLHSPLGACASVQALYKVRWHTDRT